jgi:hypothetical protein
LIPEKADGLPDSFPPYDRLSLAEGRPFQTSRQTVLLLQKLTVAGPVSTSSALAIL